MLSDAQADSFMESIVLSVSIQCVIVQNVHKMLYWVLSKLSILMKYIVLIIIIPSAMVPNTHKMLYWVLFKLSVLM